MARVVVATNYPLGEVSRLVAEGRYPAQHLWGVPALERAGHDVEVLPDSAFGRLPALTAAGRHNLGDAGAQAAALRRWRPGTLTYAPDPTTFAGLALLRAARLWPGPLCAVVHPGLPTGGLWSRALRGYDVVVTLSRAVRDRLVHEVGRSAERTLWAPWGPDLGFTGYASPGRPGDSVVATGKTSRDTSTLLAALQRAGLPATVHVERPPSDVVPAHVDLRVHGGVLPYLDALADLRAAGVVAVPFAAQDRLVGLSEIADALALGRPLVATRSPYLDVDVDRIGCGVTVEPGDVAGWVAALTLLGRDGPLREAMGQKGRAFAEEHFNAEIFGQQVVRAAAIALGDA